MRRYVSVLGVMLGGLGAACTQAPSAPSPVERAAVGVGTMAAAGDPGLAQDLAAVRAATAAFHDVDQAVAAGYLAPNPAQCVASPAGAMGVHSVNPALIQELPVIAERPEVLLYEPRPEGGFRLVGVEYFQVVLLRNRATGAVAPWFSQEPWDPALYTIVNPAPQLFGQTFQGPMAGHEPGMPWHYDLHAWIWAPNPSGTFAEWNPRVRCG
ncbi:MAG TPA: hypothetical protein VNI83_11615 [Vicinamibacterales bacterium]|nr:hypothetical protein [Vicinamibacterales bacterium]